MGLPKMWCPACREWTVLIERGTCLFCDGPLRWRPIAPVPDTEREAA